MVSIESDLLGERDEVAGRDQLPLLGHASDERLDAQEMAVTQVDDRLIVQLPTLSLDGLAELRGEPEPAHRVLPVGRIHHGPAGSASLRSIHRHVGMTQQRLAVDRVAREHADAERGADGEVDPVQGERLPEELVHAQRALLDGSERGLTAIGDRGPAGQVAQQQEELVAALTRDQIGVRVELSQPIGELDEQTITGHVAQAVVHELEVVEVHAR